ncbi:MAG: hypothetical protein KC800_14960, partial [Candidatus Eremiobacteraeota bacterium]|nr:hypothetical protein [Candidatus Eremiobacteraeota bacterium]
MRRRGHRAYALVVALGIAVILSAIALALITSQSSMSSNIAIARTDLAQAILVHQAREGLAVRLDDRLRVIDSTSLDKNFSLKYDDAALHVGWKANSGSVHRPRLKDYGIGKNFLEPGAVLPEASYDSRAKVEALGRIKLSPTQTAVDFNLPGRQVYTTVYSSSFPYAVAAPRGDVHLKSLTGFSNPTYKHAEEVASEVPFPAWVLAEGEVDVEKFPVGKAFSAVGQVNVSGGAVGLRTSIPRVGFATDVSSRLQKMSAELARGCLDKTLALTGAPLDPVGFIGLFTGRTEIASLFSAQQATMFPFVPVVSFQQTEGVVTVVLLHSPFPSDFRQSGGSDLADQLASKVKQREDAESERIKLRGEHAELYQRLKDDPENPDAKRWEKRLEALTQSITEVAGRIQKLDREIDKLKELLNDEVWNGVRRLPPQHAKEEGPYPKAGGSYLFLAEKFTEMMKRIVKGDWQGLVAEFFSYTRLYHLGGRNPEWHFPGLKTLDSDGRKYDRPEGLGLDWLSLKGTMTVPRGRNLKIRHPLQLRGDLWLQRGSTLHVVGDLEIIRPNLWHESNGDEVPPTDVGFPNGRLMIEEGATLKVDGNLTCNGGSAHEGSVLVAGPMDRVHPISSAIFCSGNFSSKHGIHPAVSMEELFSYAARDNSAFVPARDTIFHLSHVVPMLSRIIGPFEKRTCWFAEWATTTSVYWIKGVPILPVPTP